MITGPYTFNPDLMKIYGEIDGKPIELFTVSSFYALTGKVFKSDFGMTKQKALVAMADQGRRVCEMLNNEDMI